jgi:ribose transport system ATP-binding protein
VEEGLAQVRLNLRNVSKQFGGSKVLNDVSLTIMPSEVHGLLGENGSGKSTLVKILAGYYQPESGELVYDGSSRQLPLTPEQIRDMGLRFVHQDLGLIDSLTVTENFFINQLATERGAFISWRQRRLVVTKALQDYGLQIRCRDKVAVLSPFEKGMLAIVRAVESLRASGTQAHGVLVLDEAMAFLADAEREQLIELMGSLTKTGTAIVLVTHDLDDAISVCDRVTVLRDGIAVATVETANTSRDGLIEFIVGKEAFGDLGEGHDYAKESHQAETTSGADVKLSNVAGEGILPLSMTLGRGEIVGVTGLAGQLFGRIPYLLYGASRHTKGELTIGARTYSLDRLSPAKALAAGICLVPGDRQRDGGVESLTVGENVTLPALHEAFSGFILRKRELATKAAKLLQRYDVRPPRPQQLLGSLSGGNQQKAILGKWLETKPELMLLDEPTVGVDVGSRARIFAEIRHLAAAGTSVLCASSDYAELAELCDRVLVFSGGSLEAELVRPNISRRSIATECLESSGLVTSHLSMKS